MNDIATTAANPPTVERTISERTLSERTIERDLERAVRFLGTLSRSSRIFRVMQQAAGYTRAIHDSGWRKYLAVTAYFHPAEPEVVRPNAQELAIMQLDNWDGPHLERGRASLLGPYPVQHDAVFRGLRAATGASSVGTVRTFIDRVKALREGSDEDRAAAQILADRKILDAEVEAQLEAWLSDATSAAPPIEDEPGQDTEYLRRALELHDFLTDWRAQARNVIRRRESLIRLGLTSPRSSADDDELPGDDDANDDTSEAA